MYMFLNPSVKSLSLLPQKCRLYISEHSICEVQVYVCLACLCVILLCVCMYVHIWTVVQFECFRFASVHVWYIYYL